MCRTVRYLQATSIRCAVTTLLLTSLAVGGSGVNAQQQAALGAAVAFTGIDGSVLNELPRNTPFAITVTVQNQLGAEAPAGLFLNGWLRPASASNLECKAAARAYRVTQRTPIGSVDLNGPAIGVVNVDGSLTIADPELNLASANLVGATTFDELPADFVADPSAARYLVSLPGAGEIRSVTVFGGRNTVLATGLDSPGTLIPVGNGGVWIHERGTGEVVRLDSKGAEHRYDHDATALHTGSSGKTIAVQSLEAITVLDKRTGRRIAVLDGTNHADISAIDDVVVLEDTNNAFALAILHDQRLFIYYLESLADPVIVELHDAAESLVTDPQGRFAFAYSAAGGATSVVDISRGQLVQVVGSGAPVAEIKFTDNAAFLMLADQSMVGVMELASIRPGKHAEVREVTLGSAEPFDTSGDLHLLSRLLPGNEMLAVHATSFTGFILHETSAMGDAPPMSAVRLRGGTPRFVEVIDRGFREVRTGTFVTTAMLPDDGQFELVVTTGIGDLSACMPLVIAASGQADALNQEHGTLAVVPVSNSSTEHHLQLFDAKGEPVKLTRAEVTFRALEAHWLARKPLATDSLGMSRTTYDLPALGEIVVTVYSNGEHANEHPDQFEPLLLTVKP